MRTVILILFALFISSGAQAHRHHHVHLTRNTHSRVVRVAHRFEPSAYRSRASAETHTISDGRPSAWCGWWMRHEVGQDPGTDYNLARNWEHWGHAAPGPAPGVIGVMPHHVFKVIEVLKPGEVLAISGNDGHAVRTRPRSTSGVIAWREG